MPIKIPNQLPATQTLREGNIKGRYGDCQFWVLYKSDILLMDMVDGFRQALTDKVTGQRDGVFHLLRIGQIP